MNTGAVFSVLPRRTCGPILKKKRCGFCGSALTVSSSEVEFLPGGNMACKCALSGEVWWQGSVSHPKKTAIFTHTETTQTGTQNTEYLADVRVVRCESGCERVCVVKS